MSLRLIFGRAGSGKSCFCFNDIKAKLEKGVEGALILIVPEQFSFISQKNLLRIVGEKGTLQAQVLDFKRMANRVFNEVGGITHEHMDSSGKSMLIHHILEDKKEEFTTFGIAAGKQGFSATLSQTISEFKRFNVAPESLIAAAEKVEEDIALKNKLTDIGIIYSEFERRLHENYIDADDDLTLLAQRMEKADFLKNSEIWIDEFSSFTPQQYSVIEKLVKMARRVNITLTSDYSRESRFTATDVFSVTAGTESRLLKLVQENNIGLDKPIVLDNNNNYRFRDSEELKFLEQQYFSFPYRTYSKESKDICVFKASNTYTEVENAARDIARLVREEGVRYKDIAVVSRDLSRYENVVAALFREYKIPFFIDQRKDIDANLIIVLITSAIEIFTKNWSYEAIFRYLKTGFTGIARDEIDLLENYVLAAGIKGRKRWLQEEPWDYCLERQYDNLTRSERNEEILTRVNGVRKVISEPLVRFYEKIKGKTSVRNTCTALYEFLCDLKVPEAVESLIDSFKKDGRPDKVNEYSQIWNILMHILSQMVEVMGEEKIDLDQFVNVMSIGFNEHKMGLIPPALDQVLVSSVDRIKSHDVRVLFILGVNDSVFPSTTNDEGILTDADRANLNNIGVELAKDTKTQAFEEQFLIYTTLTLPSNYLRLSYAIADFEGKSLRPSIIIARLKAIMPRLKEESDVIKEEHIEDLSLVSAPLPAFNQLVGVLRKNEEGTTESTLWQEVFNWFSSKEEWRDKTKNVLSATAYTNQVEMVDEEKIRKLYGENSNYSVSRFEKYVECPFAYFVEYGLKAKERKIFQLTSPDLGSFMHSVIDRFSRKIEESQLPWEQVSDHQCSSMVSNIVDELIDKDQGSVLTSSPRHRYLTGRFKRVLTRTMMLVAEQFRRSSFDPVAYEKEFRQGSNYPPIIVELPNGEKINIVGKIDRIDMLDKEGETYIRIVDYKSGAKEFKLSDVYYGLQIQLLLYLDAVLTDESLDMDKPVLPGGMLYLRIDDPMIKANGDMKEEDLQKEILKALKMKGLVLRDVDIVKEMDKDIEGNSYIIPARLNSDGNLGKSSAATKEQFDMLRKHVRDNLARAAMDMLRGNIQIKPYKKKKDTGCDYCIYSPICQFDTTLEDNAYRTIADKSDEEIWAMLESQYADAGEQKQNLSDDNLQEKAAAGEGSEL